MHDAPEGTKPPYLLACIEKTNKQKKVQRAPTSGMYVKMKQRPASSKPPIMGNFTVHGGGRNDGGSIMVSNLVKQHKMDMQSSDRVPLGPEEAYKNNTADDSARES